MLSWPLPAKCNAMLPPSPRLPPVISAIFLMSSAPLLRLPVARNDMGGPAGSKYTKFRRACLILHGPRCVLPRRNRRRYNDPRSECNPERADMDDGHRKDLAELAELIDRHSSGTGGNETAIPGVSCYGELKPDRTQPTVYAPSLCVIAQGRTQAMLGREVYRYGPSEYLIVSVDLPITGTVTEASDARPYLCLKI